MEREEFEIWLAEHEYTQTTLAKEMGISKWPLARWGRSQPVPLYAQKFMALLDRLTKTERDLEKANLHARTLNDLLAADHIRLKPKQD